MMNKILAFALVGISSGCTINSSSRVEVPSQAVLATVEYAKVLEVNVSGTENNYTFTVTVNSPDTGCKRYADWWEVITPEGELLYRRVLLHSHVSEQPFARTGGTVAITKQQSVIVRVHMSDTGYSAIAQQGSVQDGFTKVTLPDNFFVSLADKEPLPSNCTF